MSDIPAHPKTPAEWLQYAESKIVSSIPLNGDHKTDQVCPGGQLLIMVSDWSREADD